MRGSEIAHANYEAGGCFSCNYVLPRPLKDQMIYGEMLVEEENDNKD